MLHIIGRMISLINQILIYLWVWFLATLIFTSHPERSTTPLAWCRTTPWAWCKSNFLWGEEWAERKATACTQLGSTLEYPYLSLRNVTFTIRYHPPRSCLATLGTSLRRSSATQTIHRIVCSAQDDAAGKYWWKSNFLNIITPTNPNLSGYQILICRGRV